MWVTQDHGVGLATTQTMTDEGRSIQSLVDH